MQKEGLSGRFLGRLLGPLLKNRLPLIGNVLKPLAKIVLIPLGLPAGASAIDTAIHKKMFGSGITLNQERKDFIKMVKSLEKSGLLIKGVSKTIKVEAKEQNEGFIRMLLGTLGASLLVNQLTGKEVIRAGKGTIIAGQNF